MRVRDIQQTHWLSHWLDGFGHMGKTLSQVWHTLNKLSSWSRFKLRRNQRNKPWLPLSDTCKHLNQQKTFSPCFNNLIKIILRPIVFSMDGDPTYEADFVLATLVDHESSAQSSQASVTAAASSQQPSTSKVSKDKQVNRWEGFDFDLLLALMIHTKSYNALGVVQKLVKLTQD